MMPEDISSYATMITQLCDSIDRLTETVKEVRDHLHVLEESARPLRNLHLLAEAVDYIANNLKN